MKQNYPQLMLMFTWHTTVKMFYGTTKAIHWVAPHSVCWMAQCS